MWIVTFTDMTSLLLTFFIMMLTFSSMEDEKLKQATGSLSGAFGNMTPNRKRARTEIDRSNDVKYRDQDKDGPSDPSMRTDLGDQVDRIQDQRIFNVRLNAAEVAEGMRITVTPVGNEELFNLVTHVPGQSTVMVLKEIAMMFRTLPVRLVVETHCDSELPESLLMSPTDLTMLNGNAAAEVLVEGGMAPENVGVCPRGDVAPLVIAAPGRKLSPIDRFHNRRLEILVIPADRDEAFGDLGS